MRRLFDVLVLPTVSYGSEVWGPSCSPSLPRAIKKLADVQIAFSRQLCRLKKSVTPAIIFRELSERPWVHRWWNQVIGFMHRLFNMPDDSIHAELLRVNIADAQQHPSCGNWAGGIVKQYSRLGLVSPWFSSSGITCLHSLGQPWRVSSKRFRVVCMSPQEQHTLLGFCAPLNENPCHNLRLRCPFPGCGC